MNWNQHFARRTKAMKRSTVRELLKLTARPGMISFAGGLPAPELFPIASLRAAADAVLAREGASALQYGETEGVAPLRDYVAATLSRPGMPVRRENVAIVNGSQQTLDLVGRVLLEPGAPVAVENPTYLALLSAWRPWDVRFQAVRSDAEGLDVADLTAATDVRAVYAIPNYQNPSGTCLSSARRGRLAEWLRRRGAWLLEDNPYGELRYEGEPRPHVFELNARADRDGRLESEVIYTSTFSKTLAPGLRLGYIVAPEAVIDKVVRAKQSADLHTSTLNQYLVLELLRNGVLEHQIPRLRACYRERRDAMLAALAEHFPADVRWTRPNGGMFLLVTLPEPLDSAALLPAALERQVAFVPGEDFHLEGQGRRTLRLNFSGQPPDRIREGIRRLGGLLRRARPCASRLHVTEAMAPRAE